MRFDDIKEIILVDDKPSCYSDGGCGAVLRQNRYKLIFSILKEKMQNVEREYLILGDGTFEINNESEIPLQIGVSSMSRFSGNPTAKRICDEIQFLSQDRTTLLLIDYILSDSIEKQDEGKTLACDIVSELTSKSIIKLLYSVSSASKGDKKRVSELKSTCVFDFPMSSPADAAEEIIRHLDKIDERVI